jgi:hypothetical protein
VLFKQHDQAFGSGAAVFFCAEFYSLMSLKSITKLV